MQALTTEQVNQIVQNTLLVLLAQPDLLDSWHENLVQLVGQARAAGFDEELVFVAAVLTLLHTPEDTLETGTRYDAAWNTLVSGLQAGLMQAEDRESEAMTLDRLLQSVAQAAVQVIAHGGAEERDLVRQDLIDIRRAAVEAGLDDLSRWLDDVMALLAEIASEVEDRLTHSAGVAAERANHYEGMYAAYWRAIAEALQPPTG